MCSKGLRVQAPNPASAIDALLSLKNLRRLSGSSHSDAPLGNSRCTSSSNARLPASSWRLRQWPDLLVCTLPFITGGTCSSLSVLADERGFLLEADDSRRLGSRAFYTACRIPRLAGADIFLDDD